MAAIAKELPACKKLPASEWISETVTVEEVEEEEET